MNHMQLVNELKPEAIVRMVRRFILNGGDPTFANLKKDDVVFNGDQTEQLLEHGYVTGSHAQLAGGGYSLGSAFSGGSGRFNVGSSGTKADSSTWEDKKKQNNTSHNSSSGGSSRRNSGTSSGGSTRSSSGGNSGGSSSSSDAKSTTEEVVDFIKIMLSRLSRMTELATNAIERAVGLANKQAAAADAIGKATNEMVHNQRAADAYLAKANSISLSDAYKNQIMNGSINIDTIIDEDLKKKISDFQSYYESYLSARDNALKLEE